MTPPYEPDPLPVAVLAGREREGRTLCAGLDSVRVVSRRQGVVWTIPRGYVTDWASVPGLAQVRVQPFGRHAWAAYLHDWLYSVGEPGARAAADAVFLEKLEEAGVHPLRRSLMFRAVRLGGWGGYGKAAEWWAKAFRDPVTGKLCTPPFPREAAFAGAEHGPKPWLQPMPVDV